MSEGRPSAVRTLTSPRMLALHLVGVVAVVAAVLLGLWQLDSWQQHREASRVDLTQSEARALTSVMTSDEAFPGDAVGQPVTLTGEWVPDASVYVERGDTFWVVTPVVVCEQSCEGAPAVLVVRGEADSAAADAPTGAVRLTGWLQPGEPAYGVDADPTDDVLTSVRIADAVQRTDRDLYSAYVIARDPLEAGLSPVTPASLPDPPASTALRNLLYGLEWWVFGAFAVFVWWRWCRDELVSARPDAETGSAEAAPVPSAR